MKTIKSLKLAALSVAVIGLAISVNSFAANASSTAPAPAAAVNLMTPVGTWRTIDDETHKANSEVKIVENNGVLTGTVVKIMDPAKAHELCTKCEGALKDKPIVGLQIISGLTQEKGDDYWQGGKILDPKSGKIYKLKMTPVDGGKKLDARGFIGFALLGRTQTWERVE